jgi:hypothetical protein
MQEAYNLGSRMDMDLEWTINWGSHGSLLFSTCTIVSLSNDTLPMIEGQCIFGSPVYFWDALYRRVLTLWGLLNILPVDSDVAVPVGPALFVYEANSVQHLMNNGAHTGASSAQ